MHHTKLGRTGLRVSRLCLGTMTFGLQCDEPRARAILDAAAAGGINFLDTADVYPLGGDREHRGPHRGDRRRLAEGQAPAASSSPPSASAPMGRKPWDQGNVAQAHPGRRSTRRCGGSAPTTSTSTSCTATTPTRRSTRRSRRSTPRARGQGALRRLLELPRLPGRPRARPQRGAGVVRFDSVQPRYNLLFREFERELLPLCRGRGRRRDPLQPARRRAAHRQARPHGAARRRARASRSATPARRYQDRYWHDNEFDTVEALRAARRRGRHGHGDAGGARGCWPTRRSPRRSSAPAGPSSSPTASRPPSKAAARRPQGQARRDQPRLAGGRRRTLGACLSSRWSRGVRVLIPCVAHEQGLSPLEDR